MMNFMNLSKHKDYSTGLCAVLTGRSSSVLTNGLQRRHFGLEYEIAKYDDYGNFFGHEVEEEATNAMYTLGNTVNETPENMFEIKEDCSLKGSSFELVTAPMTYELLKILNWSDMLDYLERVGYKSYDFNTGSCSGIHMHVNKKSFMYPERAAINAELFMALNARTIRRFTRRSVDTFDAWSAFHSIRYGHTLGELCRHVRKGDYSIFYNGDGLWSSGQYVSLLESRYRAVNFQNANTWEIRIFNSTLNPNDIDSIIDFVALLWDMVDTEKFSLTMDEFLTEARRRGMSNLVYDLCNVYEGPDDDEDLVYQTTD